MLWDLGTGTLIRGSEGMKKGQTHTGKLGGDVLTLVEGTY